MAGMQFDPSLTTRLTNAQSEITTIQANLNEAGMNVAANLLEDYDPSNNMKVLSSYIANSALPNLFQNLDVFQSAEALSNAISNTNSTPDLSTAFGSLLTARSFSAAIDDIAATIPNLSPDTDGGNAANIADRVSQLTAMPAAIPSIITNERSYLANSSLLLSSYSQSLQTIQAFSTYNFKAVLGAAVSDQLLNILNPDGAPALPTQVGVTAVTLAPTAVFVGGVISLTPPNADPVPPPT